MLFPARHLDKQPSQAEILVLAATAGAGRMAPPPPASTRLRRVGEHSSPVSCCDSTLRPVACLSIVCLAYQEREAVRRMRKRPAPYDDLQLLAELSICASCAPLPYSPPSAAALHMCVVCKLKTFVVGGTRVKKKQKTRRNRLAPAYAMGGLSQKRVIRT